MSVDRGNPHHAVWTRRHEPRNVLVLAVRILAEQIIALHEHIAGVRVSAAAYPLAAVRSGHGANVVNDGLAVVVAIDQRSTRAAAGKENLVAPHVALAASTVDGGSLLPGGTHAAEDSQL